MNILIVKTSAIGDVTHTLPALHALRHHYPEARIDWLVEEAAAGIIAGHSELARVLVSRRRQWAAQLKAGSPLAAFREFYQFIQELRAVSYDLIIDFQGLLKSGVLIGLARGRRKVGFGRGMEHAECSYVFLNERVPAVSMDQHAVHRELQLLAAIGVPTAEISFTLPLTAEHRQQARELLGRHGIVENSSLVAINPVATWETKLWNGPGFAEVADRLMAGGHSVVFTGSKGDRLPIEAIISAMQQPAINLAGTTSLMGLAALYERAGLVISTDTGPMHIAAATGTPVLALFGPTAPWRTGPFGDQHQVLRVGLDCSPCLKRTCPLGTIDCMQRLTVEQVLAVATGMLAGRVVGGTS